MNTTITLVQALRSLSPENQRLILQLRLASTTGLRDWFDVADALLTTESIDRALALLTRDELMNLADDLVDEELAGSLARLGLGDGALAYPEAIARAHTLRPSDDAPPANQAVNSDSTHARAALERAVLLVTHIDELIDLIHKRGLRTVSRGSISAADTTRVTLAISGLPDDLTAVLGLMRGAGLVEHSNGIWSTADFTAWSRVGVSERWTMLAQGWRDSLSPQLLSALQTYSHWGPPLGEFIEWLFPVDSSVIAKEAQTALVRAAFLGLSVDSISTEAGRALVRNSVDEATAMVASLLPDYIDKVLVQSDLTIISPGPLRPDLEAKLRAIASVESRSVASTYRLSPVLIARSMDAGRSATEIEDFLTEISSTGIPQPVSYLISDVGNKHATIRVRPDSAGTIIACSEPSLAARLAADISLRALGLIAVTETTLSSPHDASVVMRNLHNEKYPAALESVTGEIQPWEHPVAPLTATTQAVNAIAALVDRLNALATPVGESDDQWLVRQLEVAIRNRTLVTVTVALPDSTTRDFLIDPRGLSNGRFRGLDRKSQVERTLPLSSITAITVTEVA